MSAPELPGKTTTSGICAHPPERRRKKSVILCGCCCCCCCCCCLHTLGAALGSSLVNSQIDVPRGTPPEVTDRRTITGRPIYQIVLLVMTAIIVFAAHIYVVIDRNPSTNEWGGILAVELVILLLTFPAIQFAAAALALIGTAIFINPELKGFYFQSLLRIMGGMVAGFLVGIFAMAALIGFLSVLK